MSGYSPCQPLKSLVYLRIEVSGSDQDLIAHQSSCPFNIWKLLIAIWSGMTDLLHVVSVTIDWILWKDLWIRMNRACICGVTGGLNV